jgi:hypothetical protein
VEEGFGFSASFACEDTFFFIAVALSAHRKGNAMSFGLYAAGFAILTIGLIYGAFLLHLPTHWIVVGAIILLGVGILSGVKATRQRDSAA